MSETDAQQENLADPRWIAMGASRLHLLFLGIAALVTVPLAALVLWRVSSPLTLFASALLMTFFSLCAMRATKKRHHSVSAFYLFDIARDDNSASSRQGIRLRYQTITTEKGGMQQPEQEGVLLSGCFVSPLFSTIRYTVQGDPWWRHYWPRVMPLWRDALPPDAFRRTRVALLWK